MGLETSTDTSKTFLNIVQGKLRQTVTEERTGAVLREYETSDGKTGSKWELVFDSVSGTIKDIEYKESKFGEQLSITMFDVDEEFILNMPADGNFAVDFAKRLPNIDLSKEIHLTPYDFRSKETDKKIRGLTIRQDNEKVYSYYYDNVAKISCNGLPTPKGDTKKFNTAKWKQHFMNEFIFLQEEVSKIAAKMVIPQTVPDTTPSNEPDDLPF